MRLYCENSLMNTGSQLPSPPGARGRLLVGLQDECAPDNEITIGKATLIPSCTTGDQ